MIPTSTPIRPTPQRHFLGGLLPTSLLPRQPSPAAGVVGAGNSGIFRNLAARPAPGAGEGRRDGPEYVPEDEQKDGPPVSAHPYQTTAQLTLQSYQAALRDAVPPYWDTTVVLPSHNSPFGPLTSSLSGDEILIDGMPTGNFFGFVWNSTCHYRHSAFADPLVIVSASFQFVGFLLTYVLHTTHSAKYGSRVGLGITLLQFGFSLRSRAEELIQTGQFPSDPSDPTVSYPNANEDEIAAGNAIAAFYGPNSPWPQPFPNLDDPAGAPVIINSLHEAEMYASAHNQTLVDILRLPSPQDVGRANEWFSFVLMSMGWFIVLTSLGGLWRVKRFERGLKRAQRESEEAQAAANRGEGEVPEDITTTPSSPSELGPGSLAYYTTVFNQYYQGAREIQRGFFGMNGRRLGGGRRGEGHAPLPSDGDDVELFDADRFERPMASNGGQSGRRGLWGL